MIERWVRWRIAHPLARQFPDALLLAIVTALAWVELGRTTGIVCVGISGLLVISGFGLVLARSLIIRRRRPTH